MWPSLPSFLPSSTERWGLCEVSITVNKVVSRPNIFCLCMKDVNRSMTDQEMDALVFNPQELGKLGRVSPERLTRK